jgi:hypothetical protein
MNDMFRTPIDFPKATFNIDHPQSILALGSCFSQNIGERMAVAKFPVFINPFGTLFDPISIHAIFDTTNLESKEEELIFYQGYWHAVKYHGSFKHKDKVLLLEKIQLSKQHLINYLKTSSVLMLTYGTAHVWKTIEKNEIVGNCHKLPGHFFYRHLLSPDEIFNALQDSLFNLNRLFPNLNVIMSISPVRHLKMGMVENQLSKSVLKVAISALVNKMPQIYYFPAYEIMMDDLRDYRFYAQDMIHPSELAIEYIFDGFKSVFFSEETQERVKIWEKFSKSLNHKPFDDDNEQWSKYKQKYKVQLKQYKDEFPMLDWRKEEQFCELS